MADGYVISDTPLDFGTDDGFKSEPELKAGARMFNAVQEAENYAHDRSPQSVAMLDKELARSDIDPKARAILEQERANMGPSGYTISDTPLDFGPQDSQDTRFSVIGGKKAKVEEDGPGVSSDIGRATKIGINVAARDVRELVGRIPVVGKPVQSALDEVDRLWHGKPSDQVLAEDTEQQMKAFTPEMREALNKDWWNSETSRPGAAWADWRAYAGGLAMSLPESVLVMFPAMRLAKATYSAGIAKGLSKEAASKSAAKMAYAAGAIGEGALGGAASGRQVREEILGMSEKDLAGSVVLKNLMDSGLSFEKARAQLAEDSSSKAFILAGLATGVFSGAGDYVLARAITQGISGGFAKRVGKGVVSEGLLEEFPQSGAQAIVENIATQDADPTRPTTEGALNEALGGMAIGGVQGGGQTALFGRGADDAPVEDAGAPIDLSEVPTDPVVDDSLERAKTRQDSLTGTSKVETAESLDAMLSENVARIAERYAGQPTQTSEAMKIAFAEYEKAKAELPKTSIAAEIKAAREKKAITIRAKKEAPIVKYRAEAKVIEETLPDVAVDHIRLWRGNRPGEVGTATRFADSLPGIALPFRDAYKGDLSYVDIPIDVANKYLRNGVAAQGEFVLPKELAAKAIIVKSPDSERRKDIVKRSRYDKMSKSALRKALLTHERTGLPNLRAYEDSEKLPTQVAIDIDGLKGVNDLMGHESGNELLKAFAAATDGSIFHISGDEFVGQYSDPETAAAAMSAIAEKLSKVVVEVERPDGTIVRKTGVDFSHGIGETLEQADSRLNENKSAREKSGARAGRLERPVGLVEVPAKGKQDQAGDSAEVTPKRTAKQLDNDARLRRERTAIAPERDSLFAAISKLGGLDRAAVAAEWGTDPKDRATGGVFGKPVLRANNGRSIDDIGEALAELGYLSVDENGKYDIAEFEEKFGEELAGNKVYTAQGIEALAAARAESEVTEAEAAESGFNDLDAKEQEVTQEILDELAAQLDEGTAEAIRERIGIANENATEQEYNVALKEAYENEIAATKRRIETENTKPAASEPEASAGRGDENRGQAPEKPSQLAAEIKKARETKERPELDLAAQTEAELKANARKVDQAKLDKEREAKKAERKARREVNAAETKRREDQVRKERADAAVAEFELGQKPPKATVSTDEAAGQESVFDQPKPEQTRTDVRRFELGRMISAQIGQGALRPSKNEISVAADKFGISQEEARRALASFNDPDGIQDSGRKMVSINAEDRAAPAADAANVSADDFDALIDEVQAERAEPTTPAKEVSKARESAKHAAKGVKEGLAGLDALFGRKGTLGSGPVFDEETWAKARPHFQAAFAEFVEAGKSLKQFVRHIIDTYNEGIIPYLKRWHQEVSGMAEDVSPIVATFPSAEGTEIQVVKNDKGYAVSLFDTDANERFPVLTIFKGEDALEKAIQYAKDTVKKSSPETVDTAAHEAATSPTNDLAEPSKEQVEANNYKLGHIKISGFEISIENPAGSVRKDKYHTPPEWQMKMKSHYGYFAKFDGKTAPRGNDKDRIDVFVSEGVPKDYDGPIYVVDQTKGNGHFDEHKVMIGPENIEDAEEAYLENYEKGWDRFSGITLTWGAGLKKWFEEGDTTKRFAEYDSELESEVDDVSDTDTNLERDSAKPATQVSVDGSAVPEGSGGTDGSAGSGGRDSDETGSGRENDSVLSPDSAASIGERSNKPVYPTEQSALPSQFPPGVDGDQRGDLFGDIGIQTEAVPNSAVEGAARKSAQDALTKRIAQSRAESVAVKDGLDNIRETLPYLLPGQQEDVHFAEQRFARGPGVMFTNGTGTGKTYTGLGIVKRFQRQGKTDTLIIVPSDKIASDWVSSGEPLGLKIKQLSGTNDNGGSGIVVTTYANAYQNNTLAKRKWSLVVADESHQLLQNEKGEHTQVLNAFRALTRHKDGHRAFVRMMLPELHLKLDSAVANKRTPDGVIEGIWEEINKKAEPILEKYNKDEKSKVVMLSATPFAYEKTIDYAEGYLFDFPAEKQGGGYNALSGRDAFMSQHFGYRMRYNKLTQPEKEVDRGLMQRQFNTWLKREKVLSGRMLDVDQDYDRKFVLVETPVGRHIDKALEWLRDHKRISDLPIVDQTAHRDISKLISERFDYLSRRFVLEAIKAQQVIPLVQAHLDLGRKVVIYHDYKKGWEGGNPFFLTDGNWSGKNSALEAANAEFQAEFPELMEYPFERLGTAVETLFKAFQNAAIFNGDVPKSKRKQAVEKFNRDNSEVDVMIIQSASSMGISLHDTTGINQRVEFNLGLPTQPTTAIQQEGRIYRVGQRSNAMFRYLNTGTSWERSAFASTIAQRASTAENLALGEQARGLLDAFVDGFENSDYYKAGDAGEGTGGRDADRSAMSAISEYDRAKTMYFANAKKTARNKSAEGKDYFATPEPIGLKMVEFLNLRAGDSVLEPSAGHGAIARWIPENFGRTAIEPSPELVSRLALGFGGKIINDQFEDHHVVNKYDGIVMNPPFGSAGRTAVDHIAKAATHLREGGRIVAILPRGAADKKFDKWFYEESEKPIKPIVTYMIDGKETPIYKGDTIESSATWAPSGIVAGLSGSIGNNLPDIMVKAIAPEFRGASTRMSAAQIKSIKPTGKRTETYKPADGIFMVSEIQLPTVMFERAGTQVSARIVVLQKGGDVQQTNRDYSDVKTIGELFDRMENVELPLRPVPEEAAPSPAAELLSGRGGQLPSAPVEASEGEGFALSESTHIHSGDTVYTAAMSTRVDRDRYTYLNGLAKTHGGRYSRYQNKATGAVAGFVFKTAAARKAFVEAASEARLSRRANAAGMSQADVQRVVSGLQISKKATVWQSVSYAPKQVRDAISGKNATSDAAGLFLDGQIHLFADNIENAEHAEFVLLHELTHFGLRGVFGDALDPVLRKIHAGNVGVQVAAAKMRKGGMSKLEAIEEVLADRGGNAQKRPSWWAQLVAGIRDLLRTMGFTRTFSENDIDVIVDRALQFSKKKPEAGFSHVFGDVARASLAFHGSPHKFDEFDSSKIGTGEGAQAYGHGLYFAENPGVASNYKRQLSDTVNVPDSTTPIEKRVAQMAVNFGGDDPVSWLSKFFDKPANHLTPAMTPELARSVANKFKSGEFTPGGALYKVDLPDEQIAKMLDWDAPLSEQPDNVKKAFGEIAKHPALQGDNAIAIRNNLTKAGRGEPTTWGRYKVKNLYEDLSEYIGGTSSNEINMASGMYTNQGGEAAASKALNDAGIPGIKYYDGGSRAAGSGTRNYVVFPGEEKNLTILKDGDARLSRVDQTKTAAFKKWFDDSKVVDANGDPLVVYHGTASTEITSFLPDGGAAESGALEQFLDAKNANQRFGYMNFRSGSFFSPDPTYAGNYTAENKGVMYPVYIKAENPVYKDSKTGKVSGIDPNKTPDALIIRDGETILEIAVIDPAQIKSAIGNNGSFDPSNPDIRLSRNSQSGQITTAQRVEAILAKRRGGFAPLETLTRLPVQALRLDRVTSGVYDKLLEVIGSRIPEKWKAGFASDYGNPEAVIDRRNLMFAHMRTELRKVENTLQRLSTLTRNESRVVYEWLNNRDADHLIAALPEESQTVLKEVRAWIDDLGQEAVRLGQLSQEAFDAHRQAYVHRSYRKYELEETKIEKAARARSISILGDQYKGRGIVDKAPMDRVGSPAVWGKRREAGKADKAQVGQQFIRLEKRKNRGDGVLTLPGVKETGQLGKLIDVRYWPTGEALPAIYGDWHNAGVWKARDVKGDRVIMWRDFTKAERVKMGEIDEARYAIAKTFHNMIHDIEVGRHFEWLAETQGKTTPGGPISKASERMSAAFEPDSWVQVPETTIEGTKTKKYGKLAGMYLPGPVWNDVRQVVNWKYKPWGDKYATVLRAWKISKTALSPTVHTNNVMANVVMADWHDVRAPHLAAALDVMVRNTPENLAIRERFEDSGGMQGMYVLSELQREQLTPLIDQLRKEVAESDDGAIVKAASIMQLMLSGKLDEALASAGQSKAAIVGGKAANKLIDLYQAEDTVFRVAAFMKAKSEGKTDIQAGKFAKSSFLDYNINAPWVAAMRQTGFPFIAFTYRALPMMLETAARKPWKLMKMGLLLGSINALGYAMSGGDEEEERRFLPEEKAGKIFGFVAPKLIRMPWNDGHDQPVFLDVRRWIPVGDVFDLGQTHAAIPLMPAAVPGGPLALIAEILFNKSQFTGRELTKETDTGVLDMLHGDFSMEAPIKIIDHLWKSFSPNFPGIPGAWSTTAIVNAGKGKTDDFGRDRSVIQATLSSVGVKLASYPKDIQQQNAIFEYNRRKSEIMGSISSLARQFRRKGIDKDEFDKKRLHQIGKLKRLNEQYQER